MPDAIGGALLNTKSRVCTALFSIIVPLCCLSTACSPQSAGTVVAAEALSTHYVRVAFDGPVPALAGDPAAYSIVSSSGDVLAVSTAAVGPDDRSVILTTDRQSRVDYAISIGTPVGNGGSSDSAAPIRFNGSDEEEPFLERASALSSQEILLTFNRGMDIAALASVSNYEVAPALVPVEAIVTPDGQAVRLRLPAHEFMVHVSYTVRVKNSLTEPAPLLVDPTRAEVVFEGIAAVDTAGPSVSVVESRDANTVVVTFSEPVAEGTVLPQSFEIDPPLAVISADVQSFGTQVVLITQTQVADVPYSLSVSRDIVDLAGNEIVNRAGKFTFAGQLALAGVDELPRVVGAVSAGNLSVIVAFNKVMGEGIDNPAHYEIAGSDTAYLLVVDAIPNEQNTAVELVTLSQSSDEYTVHVVNVHDAVGNPLTAPDGLLPPPIGFDPTRATFRGTPPVINFEASLYTVDSATGTLVLVDPRTGVGSGVGPLGVSGVRSLAYNANTGALYGTTIAPNQLVSIDIDSGVARVIGSLGDFDVRGLAYDDNRDRLYGTTINPSRLVHIAPQSAAVSVIGSLDQNIWTLAFDAHTDTLLAANDKTLMTLDPVTANTMTRGNLMFNTIQGLAMNSGFRALYGMDRESGQLLVIDQYTGESTVIGHIGLNQPYGLAVGPLPLNEQVDTDGDGFADWFEEIGWFVTIEFDDGTTSTAHVTSDPFSRDTDGDGIWDGDENRHNFDPRTDDTDADQVSDFDEWNIWYSDPRKQDTDYDGISDLFEVNLFKTSPTLADTDGDQMPDNVELFEANRNPRIADLPLPQIKIGQISLVLDERVEYTDETGVTQTEERSATTTLSQSQERSFSTSDTQTRELTDTFSQEASLEVGFDDGYAWKFTATVGFEQTRSRGYSATLDRSSVESASAEEQESLAFANEVSNNRSFTRTTEDADMRVDVTVTNDGDVAFNITDMELVALVRDPATRANIPVATLLPERTLALGEDIDLNLGPFDRDRGPFIFRDVQIFPEVARRLRESPQAITVELSNFNVRSEDGRLFAFSSQETNDRTAGIVIDYGQVCCLPNGSCENLDPESCDLQGGISDGRVETYRVATAGRFDIATGAPLGISMQTALEDIIGITRSDNPNNQPFADDLSGADIQNSYGTFYQDLDTNDDGVTDVTVEQLMRVRRVETDPEIQSRAPTARRFWVVIVPPGTPPYTHFSELRLLGGQNYSISFEADDDQDGLFARVEAVFGSSDQESDTDGDGVGDYEETTEGWLVNVDGQRRRVYSDPVDRDSDDDGIEDMIERNLGTDPRRRDTDGDGITDPAELNGYVILQRDNDSDPSNDPPLAVDPYVGSMPGLVDHNALGAVAYATDPLSVDTDNDSIRDGREAWLGSNPNDQDDAHTVRDTDQDGLSDLEEEQGWYVLTDTTPSFCVGGPDDGLPCTNFLTDCGFPAGVCVPEAIPPCAIGNTPGCISSDPNNPDTDNDGLPDLLEKVLGSHPRLADTDGDGLLDGHEFDSDNYFTEYPEFLGRCALSPNPTQCVYVEPAATIGSDLLDTDTDDDGLSDGFEINQSVWRVHVIGEPIYTVTSNPLLADSDGDGLDDGVEYDGKDLVDPDDSTDPNKYDTDGDCTVTPANCSDGAEFVSSRDPLRQDQNVTIRIDSFFMADTDCSGGEINGGYWEWKDATFFTLGPGDTDGRIPLYHHECLGDFVDGNINANCFPPTNEFWENYCQWLIPEGQAVPANPLGYVAPTPRVYEGLHSGQQVVFSSDWMSENDDGNGCGCPCGSHGIMESIILIYPVQPIYNAQFTIGDMEADLCEMVVTYTVIVD